MEKVVAWASILYTTAFMGWRVCCVITRHSEQIQAEGTRNGRGNKKERNSSGGNACGFFSLCMCVSPPMLCCFLLRVATGTLTHTHTHTHAHTCTHGHAHMHIHTQACTHSHILLPASFNPPLPPLPWLLSGCFVFSGFSRLLWATTPADNCKNSYIQ